MPFFSIILPTYDCEKTINFCLDSILNQSFLDFEVLIMDGLSSDATLEKVKSYNDPRLIIYSEPDKGIYDAMNKGIHKAKGAWFYFIGSDDSFYDFDVLFDIYSIADKSNLDVIYGNAYMMKTGLINDGEFDYNKIQTHPICHQAIFYSHRIFHDFGDFNLKYKIAADVDLNIKWFFSKKHLYKYVDRIVANYSETGISSSVTDSLFYAELPQKLVRHGKKVMNVVKLKEYATYAAIYNKREGNKLMYLYYLAVYYYYRIIDFAKRRIYNNSNNSTL